MDCGDGIEVETKVANYIAKGEEVEYEEEWTKHQTLGGALGQRSGGGGAVDELLSGRYDLSLERAVPVMLREDSR